MLLPREQSPWNCGYFLGAVALRTLSANSRGKLDLSDLQRGMSSYMRRSISPTQVVAAAAWLYLIGAVELDDNGTLVKCN
jgi:hypothetical protein